MSPKEHGRILYLDGWRGLAITTVLVGHFVPGCEPLGGLGVDLFFVLSGRLMAQILVEEKFPLPTFFLRRFSRIYPALLVFATTMLFASMAARIGGYGFNSLISSLDYFAALTMWMNYKIAFFGEAGAVSHLWSISVEEHSYIVLSILAALFARGKAALYAAAALSILALVNGFVLGATPGATEHTVFWRTDVRIAPLFLSFAIYLSPTNIRRLLGYISPAMLCFAFLTPFFGFSPAIELTIISLILAGSVNGLDHAHAHFKGIFEGHAIRFIGVTSYSIYLWQQPMFTLHERVSSFILVPLIFALALGSYYFVEQPARRQLNRLTAGVSKKSVIDPVATAP